MTGTAGFLAACALAAVFGAPASATTGDGGPVPEYVPGHVIVRYDAGVTRSARDAESARVGTAKIRDLRLARTQLLKVADGDSVAETIEQLEALPGVAYAEPDFVMHPMDVSIPDDPFFPQEWGLDNTGQGVLDVTATPDADIDAPEAWAIEKGSPNTIIADVDTGANMTQADIAPNLWTNPANGFHGEDFVDFQDGAPSEEPGLEYSGHGTHTAGTIAARGNNGLGVTGVSQRAALMILRICGPDNCNTSRFIDAIEYLAAHGARAANGSFAGSGGTSLAATDAVEDASNTLFVFAAGNGVGTPGVGVDASNWFPCNMPAPNVLCVGASNQNDQRASFSNFGSAVDLYAPGTETFSTGYAANWVYGDTFASGYNWTSGSDSPWSRSDEAPLNSFGITDSPGGDYANSTTYTATSPVFHPLGKGCVLTYNRSIDLAAGDRLYMEIVKNGFVLDGDDADDGWTGPFHSGYRAGEFAFEGDYINSNNLQIRFRLVTDGSGTADGAHFDDFEMACEGGSGANVSIKQGTSMATPHVTGAAGLIFSRNPDETPLEAKAAILQNVDTNASFGTPLRGRLNVYHALQDVPADTTITAGPVNDAIVSTPQPAFEFRSTDSDPTFECAYDAVGFSEELCNGEDGDSATLPVLDDGPHTFQVRTIDQFGNVETVPAARHFAVDRQISQPPPPPAPPGGGGAAPSGSRPAAKKKARPKAKKCRKAKRRALQSKKRCAKKKKRASRR